MPTLQKRLCIVPIESNKRPRVCTPVCHFLLWTFRHPRPWHFYSDKFLCPRPWKLWANFQHGAWRHRCPKNFSAIPHRLFVLRVMMPLVDLRRAEKRRKKWDVLFFSCFGEVGIGDVDGNPFWVIFVQGDDLHTIHFYKYATVSNLFTDTCESCKVGQTRIVESKPAK